MALADPHLEPDRRRSGSTISLAYAALNGYTTNLQGKALSLHICQMCIYANKDHDSRSSEATKGAENEYNE